MTERTEVGGEDKCCRSNSRTSGGMGTMYFANLGLLCDLA